MDDLRATHPAAVNDPVRIPPANHDKRQELIRCQTALPCMDANGGAVQMDALQALVAHNDLDRVDASPVLAMQAQRAELDLALLGDKQQEQPHGIAIALDGCRADTLLGF